MKNAVKVIASAILALAAVNLLVACDPKRKGGGAGAGGTAPQEQGQSPLDLGGTSDSGGGTAIDGKMIESYIIDPLELPAAQKHVAPLLKNVKSDDPENDQNYGQFAVKLKTWYLAPVVLEKVKKDALGLEFIESETDQPARQTDKSVWIDSEKFKGMDLVEQGKLILHEIVMTAYMMKFTPFIELCKTWKALDPAQNENDCEKSSKQLDKVMPPETRRPLNKDDNENIRVVTAWLWKNLVKPMKEAEVNAFFLSHGFDRRFFSADVKNQKEKELEIQTQDLYDTLKGSELSGYLPDQCTGLNSGETKPCKIEIGKATSNNALNSNFEVEIKFTLDGQPPVTIKTMTYKTMTLVPNVDGNGVAYVVGAMQNPMGKFHVGDRRYIANMIFKMSKNGSEDRLDLDRIVLRPMVIYAIDKAKEYPCAARAPKVNQLMDDAIFVHAKDAKPSPLDLALGEIMWNGCMKDEVD